MKVHKLKTWPSFFEAVMDGSKTFELRVNDRDFVVGDRLVLEEWDPETFAHVPRGYTGRTVSVDVTYILFGGRFGLPQSSVVMGIQLAADATKEE